MPKFSLLRRLTLLAAFAALLLGLQLLMPTAARADDDVQCMNSCASHTNTDARSCAQSCNLMQIDQRCLSICMSQGNNGTKCRASCSYIKPGVLDPIKAARSNAHSQFTQMSQGDPSIITLPAPAGAAPTTPSISIAPTAQPLGPSTNYKCVAACTQQGMSLGYCTQNCSY